MILSALVTKKKKKAINFVIQMILSALFSQKTDEKTRRLKSLSPAASFPMKTLAADSNNNSPYSNRSEDYTKRAD